MPEISLVKAFIQVAEYITAGQPARANEVTQIIVNGMERNKADNEFSPKIKLSRTQKKLFSF